MITEKTAEELVLVLKRKKLHISLAESCTGGMVAAALTAVSGASEVFELGVVSYSERIKNCIIDVKQSTLEKYTVYSAQTAEEMALGVLKLSGADLSVAVTGLAGPNGGTKERPVGLVYISVAGFGRVMVQEFHFSGNRTEIRRQTVENALFVALKFAEDVH
ncbi:MAG: CinA family protein [Bacillota bacterium]|jgi:PncC family amidohydrolase